MQGTLVPICEAWAAGNDVQLVIHWDQRGRQACPGPGGSNSTVIAHTYVRRGLLGGLWSGHHKLQTPLYIFTHNSLSLSLSLQVLYSGQSISATIRAVKNHVHFIFHNN